MPRDLRRRGASGSVAAVVKRAAERFDPHVSHRPLVGMHCPFLTEALVCGLTVMSKDAVSSFVGSIDLVNLTESFSLAAADAAAAHQALPDPDGGMEFDDSSAPYDGVASGGEPAQAESGSLPIDGKPAPPERGAGWRPPRKSSLAGTYTSRDLNTKSFNRF